MEKENEGKRVIFGSCPIFSEARDRHTPGSMAMDISLLSVESTDRGRDQKAAFHAKNDGGLFRLPVMADRLQVKGEIYLVCEFLPILSRTRIEGDMLCAQYQKNSWGIE